MTLQDIIDDFRKKGIPLDKPIMFGSSAKSVKRALVDVSTAPDARDLAVTYAVRIGFYNNHRQALLNLTVESVG